MKRDLDARSPFSGSSIFYASGRTRIPITADNRVHQVDGTVEVGRVGGDGNFLDHLGRVSPDDSGAVYNAESQQYEAYLDHVLTATDRTE